MRSPLVALVLVACSGGADSPTTSSTNHPGGSAMTDKSGGSGGQTAPPGPAGSQAMSTDNKPPGGTGVDEHGVLLRSKPDPNAPKPDQAMLADDESQLLFYAGGLLGDPAIQRRVWQQLELADASGAPTARMTEFIRAHQEWVKTKASVAATVATPAKAKAYLDSHLK